VKANNCLTCIETRGLFTAIAHQTFLEYAIWRDHLNQEGFKLKGTHQLLVYAHDVNTLGGSVYTIKENTEALVTANRETGLKVKAEETKYMIMSRDQNAGPTHNLNTDNKSFKMVEQFKYFGTKLMNQNSIQEDIKSRLKSGNACYQSVQKSSFFQFTIQTYKDYGIQNSNFACCVVWV
jgi:hypothetical protein